MGKKNLSGVRERARVCRPNWLRGVFWPARKIDKNVRINAGRGSGTTGCHLAFLYKSLLGLKDVPSRRALANI